MLKKLLFTAVVLAFLAAASFGQPNLGTVYHEVQVVDEEGINVTDITSVDIYNVGTTTSSTIYKSRGAVGAITLPMTTATTNTTLSSGYFYWWGPEGWDFSITDGTNTHTNYSFRARTASETKITFPSYLHAASTTTWTDATSITMGTGSDWVINAGTTDDLLTFVPATDGAVFRIGTSGTTKNADFEVYTGTGVGLLINEGTSTFGITGLTVSINAASNYATNINTSTSTGAVTIGSGTSGAWAIDGTTTGTINADDSIAITASAGTIGIASTGGDLTIDATDKSVIIDGGEAAADAVTITATGTAGGIDITSLGDIDITTTGADGEDISIINTGGSVIITATEAVADSIVISSSTALGGIDITSQADIDITTTGAATEDISITNTGGSVLITATEAVDDAIVISASTALGGIDITSNADIDITTTGAAGEDIILTNTGGSIVITATEAIADAIGLISTGGVDITSAATFDIDITATGGTVQVIASEAAANQFKVDATGTVAGYAIVLETTDGGVQINSDGAANGDIAIDAANTMVLTADPTIKLAGAVTLNTVETFTDSDATPDVTGATFFNTNTTTFTITDFDGAGIAAGQLIMVLSKGAITYDVTTTGIKGGSTDIITAAGDLTTFIYDGTDWYVVARYDVSDDLN